MHIAILGGGLSGLSSAFHLSRRFPKATLSLYERQSRLGGWVHSTRHPLTNVLLESGPRTLRPNSKAVLELIHLLGLENQVIRVDKSSAAAQNRYLHVPPTKGLTRLPTSILDALRSPLRHVFPSAAFEVFRLRNRGSIDDESVDSFLSRRFGPDLARILGSALVHGIYAADSRSLSVRAAFPSLWEAETRGWGSVIRGLLCPTPKKNEVGGYELGNIPEMMNHTSVFSFKNGIGQLVDALVSSLRDNHRVQIHTECSVSSLALSKSDSIELTTGDGTTTNPTHIASTIPLPVLSSILPSFQQLPHLDKETNPYSSVCVVNLVFPGEPGAIHPEGFGYLVPRHDSEAMGGWKILGTVFDSSSLPSQDSDTDPGKLTKMTVMLSPPTPSEKMNPPSTPAIDQILHHLSEHLSRSLPTPVHTRIMYHQNCIPLYTPGHVKRMEELRGALRLEGGEGGARWKGRMEVIGAGVGGVSVGDCVEAGRGVGMAWGLGSV